MKIVPTGYCVDSGWISPLPPELDSPQTLVLAFAAPQFGTDVAPWQQLARAFPKAIVAGCSTAGEISGSEVHDASISVAVIRFERTELRRAWTIVAGTHDSLAAGGRLAEQLIGPMNGKDLSAVFVLSGGLEVNGTLLVQGLNSKLPQGVSVSGGLAGDGSRFAGTWVLDNGQPRTQGVCAIGFYGAGLRVGQGCAGGWSDFGPERRVTSSQGNVLSELDSKPALELYKSYLGDLADGLPGTALLFPLSIRRDGPGGDAVVRTILGIDEVRQSLTFAGDIPQGAVARLMRANTDKLISSAGCAARAAAEGAGGAEQALVISVSCVGRRSVLGQRTEEEVEMVCDATAGRTAHVGFYSYGEIAANATGGASDLHNQTMTVTVIRET